MSCNSKADLYSNSACSSQKCYPIYVLFQAGGLKRDNLLSPSRSHLANRPLASYWPNEDTRDGMAAVIPSQIQDHSPGLHPHTFYSVWLGVGTVRPYNKDLLKTPALPKSMQIIKARHLQLIRQGLDVQHAATLVWLKPTFC